MWQQLGQSAISIVGISTRKWRVKSVGMATKSQKSEKQLIMKKLKQIDQHPRQYSFQFMSITGKISIFDIHSAAIIWRMRMMLSFNLFFFLAHSEPLFILLLCPAKKNMFPHLNKCLMPDENLPTFNPLAIVK